MVAVNGLLIQLARPMDFIGYTVSEIRQSLVDMDTMLRMFNAPTAAPTHPSFALARTPTWYTHPPQPLPMPAPSVPPARTWQFAQCALFVLVPGVQLLVLPVVLLAVETGG